MPEYGEPLTEREKEILRMVATGVTNRQAAHHLSISVNTVKVHLRHIFTKLGAESRTEATMIAVREGWIVVEDEGIAEGETTQSEAPPAAPEPPLPWFKRVTLVTAVLIVTVGTAMMWPRNTPQGGTGSDLPLDQSPERPGPILPEGNESSWHERAHMPTRRAHMALVVVDDQILAIGGRTPEAATGAVEAYDPENDVWMPRREKPTPVAYIASATIGTEAYVPGGCDAASTPTRSVEVYEAHTDSWRQASPLPEPRCAYALAAWQGRVYLFGGWDGAQYVATTYIYDPQTDTWTETTPMETGRGFAAAATLGDRIYVVGGYDGERELTTCAAYDPTMEAWEQCTPLAIGRGGLGLAALDGQLYAIGGGGWTSHLGFNERYNPSDDTWRAVETPLVEEWRSPGVVAVGATIYAIGGWSNDYLSLNQAYEPLPFRIFIPVSH